MRPIALLFACLALPLSAGSQVVIVTEPSRPTIKEVPQLVHISTEDTADGFVHRYGNGIELANVYEPFAAYQERTGCDSLQCSTGHCGTAASPVVKPAAGCTCGCNAGSCSCAHSPNVTLTAAQKIQSAVEVMQSPAVSQDAVPTSESSAQPVAATYHYVQYCEGGVCRWRRVPGLPRAPVRKAAQAAGAAATAPVKAVGNWRQQRQQNGGWYFGKVARKVFGR